MIKKIAKIHNLGVYKDFTWDGCVFVKKENGEQASYDFAKINIIYGRNYTGKTTLSRLVNSLKTGFTPRNYENSSYMVEFADNSIINHQQLTQHSFDIRVFNQDYINANLGFLSNEINTIKSFVVLGEHNNELEEQIRQFQQEIGQKSDGENSATGLYAELHDISLVVEELKNEHDRLSKSKEKILTEKATIGEDSFKQQNRYFGNNTLTYNKTRLENDLLNSHEPITLTDSQIADLRYSIDEEAKEIVASVPTIRLDIGVLIQKTEETVEKPLSISQSIQELLNNSSLENWVRNGKNLHEQLDSTHSCLFCSNPINPFLWDRLDQHFTKQSENLLSELDSLNSEVNQNLLHLKELLPFQFEELKLYHKYRSEVKTIQDDINKLIIEAQKFLEEMSALIQQRIQNINIPFDVEIEPSNHVQQINQKIDELNKLINASNDITNNIDDKRRAAQNTLFNHEIMKFKSSINFDDILKNIEASSSRLNEKISQQTEISRKINEKTSLIATLEQERMDENRGAERINLILAQYLIDSQLRLEPLKENGVCHYRVVRQGSQAFNLSEGEKSLIAFCYFMVNLDDKDANSSNRIIWIDDPISSLDSDNIFFIYSLIRDLIAKGDEVFKQIFISTHNLEFLKFSKRLGKKTNFYLINKSAIGSKIQCMPNYLRVYTTEFNYLFENIYRCATEEQDDTNFHLFYNFGNNCRKFLEIYLAFKFPTVLKTDEERLKKLTLVFGEQINTFFIERINNEYSHLAGSLERATTPIDKNEIKTVASFLINKLKELDEIQYNAFIESINENRNSHLNNMG